MPTDLTPSEDPRQISDLVERNCEAWERRLRGHSGPATIQICAISWSNS